MCAAVNLEHYELTTWERSRSLSLHVGYSTCGSHYEPFIATGLRDDVWCVRGAAFLSRRTINTSSDTSASGLSQDRTLCSASCFRVCRHRAIPVLLVVGCGLPSYLVPCFHAVYWIGQLKGPLTAIPDTTHAGTTIYGGTLPSKLPETCFAQFPV